MAPLITLITGCSSGIGLSTAIKLAQDPNKSYLVYATMRNLAKKDALEKEADNALNDILFVKELDINKEDQVVSTVQEIVEKHGKLDVLINNAAFGYFGLFEEMSMDDMRSMLETNMIGTYRLTQEVIPIMKKQMSGRIVNISSVGGVCGSPYSAVYCATKFAMEGLTEALYPELKCFKVWISSICPGAVTTNFVKNLSSNKASGEFAARANDPESPSGKLMSSFLEMVPSHMKNTAQQAPDVADVVVECLREEQPKIRYGTSDYSRGRMSQKYADGVGGERAEEWYQLMSKLST
ncbi:retinol dehydrogenase 8-like [Diadema setosum]|uniref:retinol dehydrogenase 8-like n=1 Tax=Diadema setosum TaxID=31175 RepID=UPI003B3AC816